MPKFNCQVVIRRGLDIVEFAPGDTVPAWALDEVGEHVISGNPIADPDFTKQDAEDVTESEEDKDATEAEAESGDGAGDSAADSASSEDAAPDFTKAAPAKRRTRKQA